MKTSISIILLATIIFSASYWYLATAAICPVPISYRLGDIDSRFNITAAEAVEVLSKAESVWETAVNRDLFVYDDQASFSLNFIYDERQQLASTEEEWRVALDIKERKGTDLIDAVKVEATAYEEAQAEYLKTRESYDVSLSDYNNKVEAYNRQGGAPPAEFAALEAEQKVLARQLRNLQQVEDELNDKAEQINQASAEGNSVIESYNFEVLQYNEIYGDLDIYTQGDFKKDRINIYKFSNTTELTKVLTHEFGHALGLDHVEGNESIMYYLMEEQPDAVRLTEQDLKGFFEVCGNGPDLASKFRGTIRQLLAQF